MSFEVNMNPLVNTTQDTGQQPASPTPSPPQQGSTAAGKGSPASGNGAVSEGNLTAVVSQLNQQAQQVNRALQFLIDKDSGSVVIKVIDTQTKEVIRQIPPEDILDLRRHLKELSGILLRAHA